MFDFRDHRSLSINGKHYKETELKEWCLENSLMNDYRKDTADFISNWLSDDENIKIKTSGTTGRPVTLWVEKNSMLHSAGQTLRFFNLIKGKTLLSALPVKFIGGKMLWVRAILGKLNVATVKPSINPLEDLDSNVSIDFAAFTPHQLHYILENPYSRDRLESVPQVIIGGAPMGFQLEDQIKNLGNTIYHTYGMTETLSHIALRKVNVKDPDDRYQLISKAIKIKTDSRSCLVIEADYLKDPVITNDIVKIKEDGKFNWMGRYDNVINSGGIKLMPESIEKRLAPYIPFNFFVAGMEDDILGQKLVLCIEGKEEPYDLKALNGFVGRVIQQYEIPKEIIYYTSFIYASNNKIDRAATLAQLK